MNLKLKGRVFSGGIINAPPSKSQSQRALLIAAMASGKSEIANILPSPDIIAMQKAIVAMGAKIKADKYGKVVVTGVAASPKLSKKKIDVGGSGQVLRFFAAVALCQQNNFTLLGDESISNRRSMADLCSGFEQLGIKVNYLNQDGFAPVTLAGKLQPGRVKVSGEDSQVVSALLLAAYYLDGVTSITVTNPGERPWLNMTTSWLEGSVTSHNLVDNMLVFNVVGKPQRDSFNYFVPGDFSSIAYIVAAAMLLGVKLEILGLDWNEPQGDSRFIDILLELDENRVLEKNSNSLKVLGKAKFKTDVTLDVNSCIDMVTIIAVVASCAEGVTTITGAAIAQQKESKRLDAIATELTKMGADIKVTLDGLIITGGKLVGARCSSWNDHRIAMSLAVAGLVSSGESVILGAECVTKSYPGFWQDLSSLGAIIGEVC